MSKRKKYVPKPCVLPLGMRRHDKMEIPGYMASLAMGQPHFCEQHVYDLLSSADLAKRIAPDDHPIRPVAQAMIEACAEIQRRAEKTGKTGVTGDELCVLRAGVAQTMDFLRRASNVQIDRAARAAVSEFNRTGALRV